MSESQELDVVTGAFSYTGQYITRRLMDSGRRVRTITGHPGRPHSFEKRVEAAPLDFTDYAGLLQSLCGASVLYNTYWVRFRHGQASFDDAVRNSRLLIRAAQEAGVRKIVHLSIANPSLDSLLPYYAGKAQLEKAIVNSGLAYAILRPTVIFGVEDILINNIAGFARHFPVFAIPGDGRYRLQPMFVGDLAQLAVSSAQRADDCVVDAVGPESFAFEELVELIAASLGVRLRLLHVSAGAALRMLRALGPIVGDVILTREEIEGLMANLLVSNQPATGATRFTEWLQCRGRSLGRKYSSELYRHYG